MTPLSPIVSLATQVSSQPGVFAALLGSGVSTGAGLPTGWQIVKELVRRAAVAQAPGSDGPISDEQVEAWWQENGTGDLGYSQVLSTLAATPASRQALLERFFEGNATDGDDSRRPSEAHQALARLVARGSIRVILTTNFDRLMEQALGQEHIHPQVISRPEAVVGMKPLAHAPATVIKLHGDYKDLTTLNTPEELGSYPQEWLTLIDQVLDEYGLIIAGWSADWDTALVQAIESSTSRRYPTFWDSRSSRGEAAQRLLVRRSAAVLESASADDLFNEIEASIAALDRLAEPPITTAIAEARLKRYLHDPLRRIDLHDLVMSRLTLVGEAIEHHGSGPVRDDSAYGQILQDYLEASRPLIALLATGVRHDIAGQHDRLWIEVLDRLLAFRRLPAGTFNQAVWAAQHYPALLAFYAMSGASITAGHEDLMIALGRDLTWTYPFNGREPEPAAHALRPDGVLDWNGVNALTRWSGTKWQQPPSHLVRSDLHEVLVDLVAGDDTKRLFDDIEYRHDLLVTKIKGGVGYPLTGEYRGDTTFGDDSVLEIGQRFRASAERAGHSWPWRPVVGKDIESTLSALEKEASRRR